MGFRPPTFNLPVNLWRFPNTLANPADFGFLGNLSPGKRVLIASNTLVNNPTAVRYYGKMQMELLCPALTDIRPSSMMFTGPSDLVEVPAGSGRIYLVTHVDDSGKGFTNEYRLALLIAYDLDFQAATSNAFAAPTPPWPLPIP